MGYILKFSEGPHPNSKGEDLRTPKASDVSPQGKEHDEVTTEALSRRNSRKMQPKLPDIIIWLKQKIHVNYGIVQAGVMKSSHDSIILLPIIRTADKSSHKIQLMFCTYFYTTYRN